MWILVAPRRPLAAGMPAAKGRYTPAAGGRGRAAQQQGGKLGNQDPPNAPHPPHAGIVVTRDDLTRNIAQLKLSRIFAAESARISRGKVSLNTYLTMAKMQGITGKLSGKMGAAVFRVRDGQQVVTQYNPIVKNPNTSGQQTQRAKFKLMSQLAAIMAPGFGTMSITTRKAKGKPSQRNAFTQLNFPLVEVTSDDQVVTAKIPMEQLKLTSSFRFLPSLHVETSGGDTIIVDPNGELPAEISSVRFVVVGYVGNVATILEIRDVPASGFREVEFEVGKGNFTVLAYGLIPSESAKATIDLDNIHTPADEDFISAVELNAMVEDGSIVETMTVGANVEVSA